LAGFLEGLIDANYLRNNLRVGSFSPGIDVQRDLIRLGVINQTTMLASESRAIGDRLKRAIEKRDGAAKLEDNFRDFDTICRATQDNQDAAAAVAALKPDVYLVVGGYDSSNTKNLARVGRRLGVPAYHIEGPHCVGEQLEHRHRESGEVLMETGWLPPTRPLKVAFTAGASTPDALLGEVIDSLVDYVGKNPTKTEK